MCLNKVISLSLSLSLSLSNFPAVVLGRMFFLSQRMFNFKCSYVM